MTLLIASLQRGDICLVNLDADTVANEQKGYRPCVVIGKQDQVGFLVIVPITTTEDVKRFAFTLELKRSGVNNLVKDSIAMVFQIRAISVSRISRKTGILEDHYFSDILKLISAYFGLNNSTI